MQKNKKIRIKDIANLAGVSEGTVDRVLHNRGEVSEKSRKAVEKILKEIDYSPNILARSLSSKKIYRFICIIPSYKKGEYWEQLDKGFDMAISQFVLYNVVIEKRFFDQFDPQAFVEVSEKIVQEMPDAVIIAPIFRDETLNFTSKLDSHSIPFSFIDSIIDNTNFVTYYGQNSSQSGYIGAKLLVDTLKPYSKILVVRTQRKHGSLSNQTIKRYQGFKQYIEENNNFCELIEIVLVDDNDEANIQQLQSVFSNHPDIKAAITFNSKVFRLAKFINDINRRDVVLLGYDLLQENIHYLKSGIISYLIAQRPEKQAYRSVEDLCNKFIFNKHNQRINFMPIDILMKENIDYFVDFQD
ncbi:substrate-binding domain-containing protein [Paludibacter sp.]